MKKKLLLAIIFAFGFTICTKAQFMPQVSATYEVGCGPINQGGSGVDFVASWGIGDHWRIGAGVGMYELDFKFKVDENHYSKALEEEFSHPGEYEESCLIVPYFLDAKYNFTQTKTRPYLNTRLCLDNIRSLIDCYQKEETNDCGTLYFGAGVDFSMKRGKLFLQCGFKMRDYELEDSVHGVQFSIGYCWDKRQKVTTNKKGTIIK